VTLQCQTDVMRSSSLFVTSLPHNYVVSVLQTLIAGQSVYLLWLRASSAATIMFLLRFFHIFYLIFVGNLSCWKPLPTGMKFGRDISYHKAQIGCSFHSNRPGGFRGAGLHINANFTHSCIPCIPRIPRPSKRARRRLPTTNSLL
jgi:hypothetical protein